MSNNQYKLSDMVNENDFPAYAITEHNLGYQPKYNHSRDYTETRVIKSLPEYKKYIRDIFNDSDLLLSEFDGRFQSNTNGYGIAFEVDAPLFCDKAVHLYDKEKGVYLRSYIQTLKERTEYCDFKK